jgi:predicted nuclease of predicted toxin-antitoxin system
MRLFADENIETEVVELLRQYGHDVFWLAIEAPGTNDELIPALVERQGRILITYDVDFISAIGLSNRSHVGAILVRQGNNDYAWIANAIHETLIGRKTWNNRTAVIKRSGIRYAPYD